MTGIHRRSPSFLARVVFPDPGRPVMMMHFGFLLIFLDAQRLLCGNPDLHATFEQGSPRVLPNVRVRMIEKRFDEFIVPFVTDNAKNLETPANEFRIIGGQELKGSTT
jgi:hypothetical protein